MEAGGHNPRTESLTECSRTDPNFPELWHCDKIRPFIQINLLYYLYCYRCCKVGLAYIIPEQKFPLREIALAQDSQKR